MKAAITADAYGWNGALLTFSLPCSWPTLECHRQELYLFANTNFAALPPSVGLQQQVCVLCICVHTTTCWLVGLASLFISSSHCIVHKQQIAGDDLNNLNKGTRGLGLSAGHIMGGLDLLHDYLMGC